MDKNKLLAEIQENLQKLNKLYDALRITDPVNKKVVERKDFIPIDKACAYWYAEALDDNAVAVRAFQDNRCYVKLEQLSASALLITALPIGDDLILELIKNVSDSVIIDDSYYQRFNGLTDSYNNLAYQDILTGLYNRRYVDERLQKDISASIHKQQPLSMIFLDIDNLKEINDHYGHAFGDSVLKEVSQLLVRSTRESSDWAARYGGDEFLICLNNTSDDDAFEIAERIRTEITTLVILQNENIKTSASLGVYSSGSKEITAAELISLTDAKMYQAKRNGKNQTAK